MKYFVIFFLYLPIVAHAGSNDDEMLFVDWCKNYLSGLSYGQLYSEEPSYLRQKQVVNLWNDIGVGFHRIISEQIEGNYPALTLDLIFDPQLAEEFCRNEYITYSFFVEKVNVARNKSKEITYVVRETSNKEKERLKGLFRLRSYGPKYDDIALSPLYAVYRHTNDIDSEEKSCDVTFQMFSGRSRYNHHKNLFNSDFFGYKLAVEKQLKAYSTDRYGIPFVIIRFPEDLTYYSLIPQDKFDSRDYPKASSFSGLRLLAGRKIARNDESYLGQYERVLQLLDAGYDPFEDVLNVARIKEEINSGDFILMEFKSTEKTKDGTDHVLNSEVCKSALRSARNMAARQILTE